MTHLLHDKKVSILVCFYERPHFLPLIIQNLKTQTFVQKYPNQSELIIVDDCSNGLRMDIDRL